ncbi:hypothetical protein [Desulforamulus profundi]|uniref:hypothetical protein n=1 Tax=Desulforamulus profundi TaxID=1383067 RepID=UPI001EE543EA|nr:hypothetical protein [Desulforamulus profundi]
MMEGALAGLNAAAGLGYTSESLEADRQYVLSQLEGLRSGPVGEKIRKGLAQAIL